MEANGHLHAPAAFPPGKQPSYSLKRRLCGPQNPLDLSEVNGFPPPGIETQVVEPKAQDGDSSCSKCTCCAAECFSGCAWEECSKETVNRAAGISCVWCGDRVDSRAAVSTVSAAWLGHSSDSVESSAQNEECTSITYNCMYNFSVCLSTIKHTDNMKNILKICSSSQPGLECRYIQHFLPT